MPAIPDDILKSFEVATQAMADAHAFDSQILEDYLKYSSWISALGIASLLMIAANFGDLARPGSAASIPLALALSVLALTVCLGVGGLFHRQAILELKNKRMRITLVLKQHSIALSTTASFAEKPPLCEQVWDYEFLSEADRKIALDLNEYTGARKWLIWLQAGLLAFGILLVFLTLFADLDAARAAAAKN